MTERDRLTDEQAREAIRQALFEGALPRGFTGQLARVYKEMLEEGPIGPPGAAKRIT